METGWHFSEARPGDRARESLVEKFFNSDAVANRANAIVREGIQNSLDAAVGQARVRVRIALGAWEGDRKIARLPVYTKGFSEHFEVPGVHSKIANPPGKADEFRYLVFEDFGTSGLGGDPAQWWPDSSQFSNPYFNYFRAEGISEKTDGARGRHGVGRLVFMFASRVRSIFGLTRRDDGRELLMGTAVLRNHRFQQKPYLPDGWFGVPSETDTRLILPVEGTSSLISAFKSDFGISRKTESGLSVIVPWLSHDINESGIVRAVLAGYFLPILRDRLEVEVVSEQGAVLNIRADTLDAVVDLQNEEFSKKLKPAIAISRAGLAMTEQLKLCDLADGAPKWDVVSIPEEMRDALSSRIESGEVVSIRVPVQIRLKGDKASSESHFDVFLQRDVDLNDGQIHFVREDIIISDVRPRRTSGIRAIVVVDEGPLATFLGDAENPSHTQWQRELVREKYSFHSATIDFVVNSVPQILALVSDIQKKPDSSLLIDLFSLTSEQDLGPKRKEKRKLKKGGPGETEKPVINPPKRLKSHLIQKLTNGFRIRKGDPSVPRPPMLGIEVAYGVRRGSPFSRYDPADFQIGKDGVQIGVTGGNIIELDGNYMLFDINSDDFEIEITGFDTNRDLHVDVRVKDKEVADAAAS